MMTILEMIKEATEIAKARGHLCYLYEYRPGKYCLSFDYWNGWLFKAYPGGRKVFSSRGHGLVEGAKQGK